MTKHLKKNSSKNVKVDLSSVYKWWNKASDSSELKMVGVKLSSQKYKIFRKISASASKIDQNWKKTFNRIFKNKNFGPKKIWVVQLIGHFGQFCTRGTLFSKTIFFGTKILENYSKNEFSRALSLKPTKKSTSAEPKIIKFIKR